MHMHSAIAVMSACLALLLLHVLGWDSLCFCLGSVETRAWTGQGWQIHNSVQASWI